MRPYYRVLVLALLASACTDAGPTYTPSGPCDAGLALASNDPFDAAASMGICDGLVSATWLYPDGSADTSDISVGHGLVGAFGASTAPREGERILVISTGTARSLSQAGYSAELDKGILTAPPTGFPKNEVSCPSVNAEGHDGIALRVVLAVPAGVRYLAFDYAYFSRDFPQYVCTEFVDQAAALATGLTGFPGIHNILLDASGNPMLASPTSIHACADTTVPSGSYPCPLGTSPLSGTGFDNYGGSGWLSTVDYPVTPGDTVRITFMVWDSGDGTFDSSLLLDNFAWVP